MFQLAGRVNVILLSGEMIVRTNADTTVMLNIAINANTQQWERCDIGYSDAAAAASCSMCRLSKIVWI